MTQLRSVTCHMGSHSVTCYPTQVNIPHLNPSHADWYSIYLPRRDGRLSWRIAPWPVVERVRRPTTAQLSECTTDQKELRNLLHIRAADVSFSLTRWQHIALLRDMTLWSPSWSVNVRSKIRLHQPMRKLFARRTKNWTILPNFILIRFETMAHWTFWWGRPQQKQDE